MGKLIYDVNDEFDIGLLNFIFLKIYYLHSLLQSATFGVSM